MVADFDEARSVRERAIDRILAKDAIREATNRYGRGIDRHDAALIMSAFHPDAIDHHGAFRGSPAELAAWGNEGHAARYSAHSHFLVNQNITIDGDHAGSELYVIFVLQSKSEPIVHVGGGRYLDRLECRQGVWAIVERTLVLDWRFEAASSDPLGTLASYPNGAWDRSDPSYPVLEP